MAKKVEFTSKYFDQLLQENPKYLGVELVSKQDSKLRAIVRKGKITLGVRTCVNNRRSYKKLATYGEISIAGFKRKASLYIASLLDEPTNFNDITLNETFEQLFIPYAQKNLKDRKTPTSRWENHIRNFKIGAMKLSKVRSSHIEQQLEVVAEKGLKPATVNKIHMLISKVFTLAIKQQIISSNPCKGVKQRQENNTVKTVFTEQQCAIFIKLATQDSSYFQSRALLLSLYTGMRIGEVVSLKSQNIASSYKYLDLLETKNGKSFRVFLNEPAKKLVQELESIRTSQFLFPSSRNKDTSIAYPRSTFVRIIQKMEGLDEQGIYTIHILRRTFATLLQKNIKDIYAVSQALNHSNVTVTQRYASIYDDDMREKINSLNSIYL